MLNMPTPTTTDKKNPETRKPSPATKLKDDYQFFSRFFCAFGTLESKEVTD
jgi:hypothetical protein